MAEQTVDEIDTADESKANESRTDANPTGSYEAASASPQVDIQRPEFAQLKDASSPSGTNSLGRFYDVNVTVSAELGRVTLPIGELVQLGEGSVVELNRPVTGPVDLVANGVRIARGEVVVVDGCFAIHIKQIETPTKAAG